MRIIVKLENIVRKIILSKKGYSDYYISFYSKELKKGSKNPDFSAKERKWAYKCGFHPWRIKQYGLNDVNYKETISDRDYFYLYPLNNQYSKWIDDKLTMKYVLAPFDQFLPRYYYHIMAERDRMKLMDCPAEYGASIDGILSFLQAKGYSMQEYWKGEKNA